MVTFASSASFNVDAEMIKKAFVYMYKDSLDGPTFLSQLDRFCPDFPEVRAVLINGKTDIKLQKIPPAPMTILLYVVVFMEDTGEVLLATSMAFPFALLTTMAC